MKISGCVDASTALEMATVADNREQYYSLTFTCSGCGWKVEFAPHQSAALRAPC